MSLSGMLPVSDPTYRIDIQRNDDEAADDPWGALIVRLADEKGVHYVSASSAHWAEQTAQEWVAMNSKQRAGDYSLYVDDDGRPVEGHSVKAS